MFKDESDICIIAKYFKKFDALFAGLGIPEPFLRYCVESINQNDPAHHLGHVFDVCELGLKICMDNNDDPRTRQLVALGCLLHDIGCKYERKHHHVIAYGMTYDLIHRFWPYEFSSDEVLTIATAVLEHRSSNPEKPKSYVSQVVSVADSGRPDITVYVQRCIKFRLHTTDRVGLGQDAFLSEVRLHLHEKFGGNGYHWDSYPDLGLVIFQDEWKEFSKYLSNEYVVEFTELVEAQFNALRW